MASSGNFCTLNPIGQMGGSDSTQKIYENGNLQARDFRYFDASVMGTIGVTSGKWYYEVTLESSSASSGQAWGWVNSKFNIDAAVGYNVPSSPTGADTMFIYADGSPMKVSSGLHDGSGSYFGSTSANFATSNIIGIAVDFDNSKAYFSQNGSFTDVRSGQNPATAANPCLAPSGGLYAWNLTASNFKSYGPWYPAIGNWSAVTRTVRVNFGQDSTFQGQVSAGGNADENGFGDFKYSVPAGFLAICSANVPVSADLDPAQTDDIPSKQFGQVLYTGSGSAQTISGLGFKPDLVWAKMYTSSQNNQLYDSNRLNSRSTPFMLRSDTTAAELDDQSTGNNNKFISAFNDDGFVLGNSGSGPNDSSRGYLAWCWKANGGTLTTDTSGDIDVVRQTNDKSKFTIATWTGNGSSGSNLPHGLGVKPGMTIIKNRGAAAAFNTWHQAVNNGDYDSFGELQATASWYLNQGASGPFSADPTTTMLPLSAYSQVNGNGSNYVGYFWADVEGMQKFGGYTGNGDSDGTFVYTGFKPAFIMTKRWDSGNEDWGVFDIKRSNYNPTSAHSYGQLQWNTTAGGSAGSTHGVDFLSNGFKLRGTGGLNNQNDGEYIYMAFADVPFKYNNTQAF